MNFTTIRRTIAFALLLLLLVGTIWIGMNAKGTSYLGIRDWLHTFCLMQIILLVSCAKYGPGSFVVRMPFVMAWGLAIGFTLSTLNLISTQGRTSLAAGAILVGTGTLAPLIIFGLHRWCTGAWITFDTHFRRLSVGHARQLSLRTLLTLTAAFAVSGVVARSAMTAPADPFGNEHDILVIQAWLGFFPCLTATPVLLAVFRPTWRIAIVGCFSIFVASFEPIALGLIAPFVLENKNFAPAMTWNYVGDAVMYSLVWHGQAVVAIVLYAVLARAAGFRMVISDQSNDKKPKPSGEPETEAGCVQD